MNITDQHVVLETVDCLRAIVDASDTPARAATRGAVGRRSPSECRARIASTMARRVWCDLAIRPSAGRASFRSEAISARRISASWLPRTARKESSRSHDVRTLTPGRAVIDTADPSRKPQNFAGIVA